MVTRIRARVDSVLREEARVLVVSRGDEALLELRGRVAGHFPQADGRWAGFYPANGPDALAHLDELAGGGFDHILLPATAFWWLEYYEGLASRLFTRGRALWHDDDCAIFALRAGGSDGS